MSFEIPVYVNGTLHCETSFQIQENEEKIDVRPIFNLLTQLVKEEWKDLINRNLQGLTFETLPFYLDKKIIIQYLLSTQSVQIKVDPTILAVNKIDLSNRNKREDLSLNLIYPNKFSSYLNLNVTKEFRHYYFFPNSSAQSNFFGSANFCFNLNEWVLEGFLYFLTYEKGKQQALSRRLNRGNIYLTKDFIEENKRVVLGDISPERVGFQNSAPLFGLQVTRNPSIFGKRDLNIGAVGQYEFFLNAPSKVDIYVNNIFIRTIELPSGPHLLENFPYADGLNQVDLVISDPIGDMTKLNLNQFFCSRLLRPGQYTYSASVGFPRFQEISQRYKYLFNNPACSSYLSRGLTQSITGSFYLQAALNSFFSGAAIIHANRFFYLESELGLSYSSSKLGGIRKKLSCQNIPNTTFFSWKFSVDFFSKYFSNFLSRNRVNPQKCFFYGSIGAPLGKAFNTTLQAYYGISRHSSADSWNIGWSLFGNPKKNISLSMLTTYKKLNNGPKFFEVVFGLNVRFNPNTSFFSNYNSRTKISDIHFFYYKNLPRNRSINTNVGYTQAKNRKQATGSLNYQGSRGSIQLNHYLYENALLPISSQSNISSVTRVNGRTSLVYTDKTFAVSKPVVNNFAIIKPKQFLTPYLLDVYTDTSKDSASQSSKFFPAVITEIPSYQNTKIFVVSEDLPLGYDLGTTMYTLHARYKSGFKLNIGGKGRLYYAEGFLIDQNENPIVYKNISVINESGSEEELNLFTNSQGKFCLFHISSGAYQLKIDGVDHYNIEIKVPNQFTGEIINLGKIAVEVMEKDSGFVLPKIEFKEE